MCLKTRKSESKISGFQKELKEWVSQVGDYSAVAKWLRNLGWVFEVGNGQEGKERKEDTMSLNWIECSVTLNESSSVVGQINLNHLTWQKVRQAYYSDHSVTAIAIDRCSPNHQ